MTRLRNQLVDDAIKFLFDEHVVVAVEDDVDAVIDQHRMDGLPPFRSPLFKFVFARGARTTPLPESSRFFPAPLIAVTAADEVMQENESQHRIAVVQ